MAIPIPSGVSQAAKNVVSSPIKGITTMIPNLSLSGGQSSASAQSGASGYNVFNFGSIGKTNIWTLGLIAIGGVILWRVVRK